VRNALRDSMLCVVMGSALAAASLAQDEKKPADTQASKPASEAKSVLDFTVKDIEGRDVALRKFEGDVLLIVNVATQCGLTEANYTQLEPLYQKYKDKGFRILAFPCNDFGGQEPGTAEEIKSFCRGTHHGTYDLFAKIEVKGASVCPLYTYLTGHPSDKVKGDVRWNFQKYLVGRDGQPIAKFEPKVNPGDTALGAEIEKALAVARPTRTEKPESAKTEGEKNKPTQPKP